MAKTKLLEKTPISKKAAYLIAGQEYRTKQDVIQRCRDILNSTPNTRLVCPDYFEFLMDVFRHHTEWPSKLGVGVSAITVQDTGHGTRCFWLIRTDDTRIDISFVHAVKHLPTTRYRELIPQPLIDFKNGARQAIKEQIEAFRKASTVTATMDMDVDHEHPCTFDALLFQFCIKHGVNPLTVPVIERQGCLHHITNDSIRMAWQDYHQQHAKLRLVHKTVNLTAPKVKVDWAQSWSFV
jgi:hypothetical protein